MASTELAFAANQWTANDNFDVKKNQVWNKRATLNRSGNVNYVQTNLLAVFPLDNRPDDFTRVITQVINSSIDAAMSSQMTINETQGNVSITLLNGTLNRRDIKFRVKGNNPNYAAGVRMRYNPR